MQRKEALKLLIELENAYGIHVGRWLDEFDRDNSSKEYLSKMMEIACELQIPFSIDLEEFREFETDCKYELQDRAAAELYYLCQHDLVERLL